jgi:hypothetical protein
MFQNIIFPILSAFLGAIFGYYATMRSATRIEAFRIFGQIREKLIRCMLTVRSHEDCPSEDVERIIPEIEGLLTALTPYLGFLPRRRILSRWQSLAYGDTPKHYDDRDTTYEYFSNGLEDVKIKREKVFSRIHKILQIKV